MQLSNESIQEFKALYQKEFGVGITYAQAEEMASELLSLYALIIPKKEVIPTKTI